MRSEATMPLATIQARFLGDVHLDDVIGTLGGELMKCTPGAIDIAQIHTEYANARGQVHHKCVDAREHILRPSVDENSEYALSIGTDASRKVTNRRGDVEGWLGCEPVSVRAISDDVTQSRDLIAK